MEQRPCPYLGAAGLGQLDNDAWRTAAAQAEGLLLFQSEFQPPPGKATRSARDPTLNENDGRFVLPAHLRAVSSESKGAHQLQAIALAEFPGDNSAGSYKLPSDVCSAISIMLQHGANLPTLRESQVAKLRSLARTCRPITEDMKRILATVAASLDRPRSPPWAPNHRGHGEHGRASAAGRTAQGGGVRPA